MQLNNLAELYQHLDELVCQDVSDDELFASGYLRGFISLAGAQFGDEAQPLSVAFAEDISEKIEAARTELSPADRLIVNDYWQQLKAHFNN